MISSLLLALLLPGVSPAPAPPELPDPDRAAPEAAGAAAVPASPDRDAGSPAVDTVRATIQGVIRSEHTGRVLPLALVEVETGASRHSAVADSLGRYRLRGVPPGRRLVRARALDHAPFEVAVEVPRSGKMSLDLSLRVRPIGVSTLTVVGRTDGFGPGGSDSSGFEPRGTLSDPDLRALGTAPGVAELGLTEAANGVPGRDPPDPSSILYVRGATSDLKLVLLDGAPVYAPFHLGGLMEAVQPGVLESSRLYTGGAPPRYDGGLSYILDLNTRTGASDRTRSTGRIDLLGARVGVEGPIGAGSYLVGGRKMHGAGPGLLDESLPYGYADGLARVDLPAGERSALSATGFWNRESVRMDPSSGLEEPAHWGNAAGSVRYRTEIAGGVGEVTAAGGEFAAHVPVGATEPRLSDGKSRRIRLGADLTRESASARVAVGASFDRQEIASRLTGGESETPVTYASLGHGTAVGAYGNATWRAAEDLEVQTGLRAELFGSARTFRLAPRVSAAWHPSEESTVSVAAGRYHQYVRAPETILSGTLGGWGDPGMPAPGSAPAEPETGQTLSATDRALSVASATHLVVGLEHDARENLRLGLEGFYKSFRDMPADDELRASGADLWFGWSDEDEAWRARAGYSLAWVWTQEPADTDARRFAGRQLLSGELGAPLPSGLDLELRVAASSGLPFTGIPVTSGPERNGPEALDGGTASATRTESDPPLGGAPTGSYLRLDATVSREWTVRIVGTAADLTPYVSLLNALDSRDGLFYHFDPENQLQPHPVADIPLLPVVGVKWSR